MKLPLVSVTIVTYNSGRYIARCLEHVLAMDYPAFEVIVVDNQSSDSSRQLINAFGERVRVALNGENKGFAGGQNQAIAMARGEWVLTLNPDVRLTPNFVRHLVEQGEAIEDVGTLCGKLLTMGEDFEPLAPARFDSTGIFFTPNLRHLDRGSQEIDRGQYDRSEYVFGATGAAALYRKRMIADVSEEGEFFDEAFFAYREDADVAWRAQLLGWRCLYVPGAVAYHVRSVLPSNRRSQPTVINMHSVKNRFLMRIKNATWPLYRRHGLAITGRDLVVIGGCLAREWSSLPAFWKVFEASGSAWKKRRATLRRRKATDDYIVSWFLETPVSYPATTNDTGDESGDELARV
jgi:GT2 family glycosyltransferase